MGSSLPKVMPLWWEFNSWVREDRVLHCRPMDNFLQHSSIAGSKPFHMSKLVDNTNFLTSSWLRGREKEFNVPFHQWSSAMFTWFRPNGSVKSILYRCLVSEQWLSHWLDSLQHVIQRDFSDHCPIILKTYMVDWGPKPFRVMDWWLKHKEYQRLVKEVWSRDQQVGWGKENGNINAKMIQNLQQKLNEVENLASDRIMSDDEVKAKKSLHQDLWDASNAYKSQLKQKSRAKWLKEGDCNTTYFHKVINFRRNYNALQGILIDGVWVQQPNLVKNEAVNFFLNRFSEQNYSRPTLEGVQFPTINQRQREELTAPF
ncbi:hypothetical protein GmHk_09G025366 [Glycine max]|nr:hypothetical protein GmHk_09G025366 [Glycine max]